MQKNRLYNVECLGGLMCQLRLNWSLGYVLFINDLWVNAPNIQIRWIYCTNPYRLKRHSLALDVFEGEGVDLGPFFLLLTTLTCSLGKKRYSVRVGAWCCQLHPSHLNVADYSEKKFGWLDTAYETNNNYNHNQQLTPSQLFVVVVGEFLRHRAM